MAEGKSKMTALTDVVKLNVSETERDTGAEDEPEYEA